jgi:hypothetical protein
MAYSSIWHIEGVQNMAAIMTKEECVVDYP